MSIISKQHIHISRLRQQLFVLIGRGISVRGHIDNPPPQTHLSVNSSIAADKTASLKSNSELWAIRFLLDLFGKGRDKHAAWLKLLCGICRNPVVL